MMSIRLNTQHLSTKNSSLSSVSLQYGSKENVGFQRLFHFFRQAFPLAFNRETFQRVYDASDLSKIAYRIEYCCQLKIYAAILASSIFDINQKRQLKILMLVEDDRSWFANNLAKRLLLQLIDTCKEYENILQIYAYVESTNIEGIQFYQMMGFQQREYLEDYFPPRASLTPNAIKLEYRIRTSRSEKLIDHISAVSNPNLTNDDHESLSNNTQSSIISEVSSMNKKSSTIKATKHYFYT